MGKVQMGFQMNSLEERLLSGYMINNIFNFRTKLKGVESWLVVFEYYIHCNNGIVIVTKNLESLSGVVTSVIDNLSWGSCPTECLLLRM